ncbi:MAG: hypothetical protein HUU17_07370 [Chthonomonadales bacterium]|nr:hypothetical protein [Chthonomonadales bacterium]
MYGTNRSLARATAAMALAFSVLAKACIAHEEDGGGSQLAEAAAPGLTAIGVLALVAIATGLWYMFRKRAMLRALRRSANGEARGERRSADP